MTLGVEQTAYRNQFWQRYRTDHTRITVGFSLLPVPVVGGYTSSDTTTGNSCED